MVQDTGATPTMSPNPAFERQRKGRKRGSPTSSPTRNVASASKSLVLDKEQENSSKEEFDWDDGWGESVASEVESTEQPGRSSTASTSSSNTRPVARGSKSESAALPSFPGTGVASLPALTGPTAQQVSSWVGTVGKKWGEIKGSTT